jgi:Amt family ammonium transporter
MAALLIGTVGATVCYSAKAVQSWLKIDDTLEVWRAHGVGGMTGALMIGVAASAGINKVEAGVHQLGVQALAVAVVGLYAVIVTWVLLKILDLTGTLRVPEAQQRDGLDAKMVGEEAYHLWDMNPRLPQ